LALAGRWARVGVTTVEQVPHVEMGVSVGSGVDVDVDQLGHSARMGDGQPGLLRGFAQGAFPGGLTRVDVAARLHPDPEDPMAMEDHAARANHEGRAGDVDRAGVLAEGIREQLELGEELLDAGPFPVVDRCSGPNLGHHLLTDPESACIRHRAGRYRVLLPNLSRA
jgi:hypothetical protein